MSPGATPTGSLPFETLAAEYDASFGGRTLGAMMRRAVWARLDRRFSAGERILELGCGTGEDAVYLAAKGCRVTATDGSPKMLDLARRKIEGAGCGDSVETAELGLEELAAADGGEGPAALDGVYDGALSNFGGLNCVEDLAAVARGLAAVLAPGATAMLCVMGPWVPWEWAWFLAHGRPGQAFRRLAPGGVDWRGARIRYPSAGRTLAAFSADFRRRRLSAVGALFPGSYAEEWAERNPRFAGRLDRWERRLETFWPLPRLADHYLLELERR